MTSSTYNNITLAAGIKLFEDLQGLIHSPSPLEWRRYPDEQDAKSGIKSLIDVIRSYERIKHQRLTTGSVRHWSEQVESDWLVRNTSGATIGQTASLTKIAYPIFFCFIQPILREYRQFNYDQVTIKAVESVATGLMHDLSSISPGSDLERAKEVQAMLVKYGETLPTHRMQRRRGRSS